MASSLMGNVIFLSLQVDVAVKILVSNGKDHVDEMTKVEAQICEGLRHPNVIQVRILLSVGSSRYESSLV